MRTAPALFGTALLLVAGNAAAQWTLEQSTAAITKSAAKIASCEIGAQAKNAQSSDPEKLVTSLEKCDEKFDDAVAKSLDKSDPMNVAQLQDVADGLRATTNEAKEKAAAVAGAKKRYTDNGDGTVVDHATGLQWQQTADPGTYTVGDATPPYLSNGTAYTTVLSDLNGGLGDCFAGYCDWRLPTVDELETLLLDAPCAPTCINASVFGAPAGAVWTATGDQDATKHLLVDFTTGTVGNDARDAAHGIRAVREAAVKNPQIPQCGTTSKCIFTTSKVSSANLGGLAGADARCNTLATKAGLPGTYVAWLSDDSTDAVARVTSDGPYQTRGGDLVASSKADLTDGSLNSPIDEDEFGPIPLREVYTNSYADGTGSGIGFSCLNWTDGTAANITPVGRTDSITSDWTFVFDQFCNRNNSIVCIQQ